MRDPERQEGAHAILPGGTDAEIRCVVGVGEAEQVRVGRGRIVVAGAARQLIPIVEDRPARGKRERVTAARGRVLRLMIRRRQRVAIRQRIVRQQGGGLRADAVARDRVAGEGQTGARIDDRGAALREVAGAFFKRRHAAGQADDVVAGGSRIGRCEIRPSLGDARNLERSAQRGGHVERGGIRLGAHRRERIGRGVQEGRRAGKRQLRAIGIPVLAGTEVAEGGRLREG